MRIIYSRKAVSKISGILLAIVIIIASTVGGYYIVTHPPTPPLPPGDNSSPEPITPQPTEMYVLSVSVSPSSGGSVNVSPSVSGSGYASGTVVTLVPSAANGWTFTGWSGDLSGTANSATVTMTSNKVITATFTQTPSAQYSLSISIVGAGCSVSKNPNQATYVSGAIVTLTPITNQGYRFDHFTVDGTTVASNSVIMNSDHHVVAYFTQNPPQMYVLSISASPSAGGSVDVSPSAGGSGYTSGTIVTLTPVANQGYMFDHFTVDRTTIASNFVTMNSAHNVIAYFTQTPPKTYALSVSTSPSSGGSVNVSPFASGSGYTSGTVVTLAATANKDYRFDRFTFDGKTNVNSVTTSVTMNSAHIIVAYFTKPSILDFNSSEWTLGKDRFFGIDVIVRNEGASGSVTVFAEIISPSLNSIILNQTKPVAAYSSPVTFKLQTIMGGTNAYVNATAPILQKVWV